MEASESSDDFIDLSLHVQVLKYFQKGTKEKIDLPKNKPGNLEVDSFTLKLEFPLFERLRNIIIKLP